MNSEASASKSSEMLKTCFYGTTKEVASRAVSDFQPHCDVLVVGKGLITSVSIISK